MSLYKKGASKASTASFLISTPQTGVDSIMVTYGLLGPLIALVRPFIALITGVIGVLAWTSKRRARPEIVDPESYPVEYVPNKRL